MAAAELQLPAGFRFHPTDEELVMHYLCRRCTSQHISVPIIAEIDLYKYDPWYLPGLAFYGEKEWYFFSPRDRKYPNGSRPNRAAGRGYWKATGADKPIGHPKAVGIKKALVFYAGKAPKGEKTNWIMHEYRLADVDRSARKQNNSLRLDDWVLCRIYNKKGTVEKQSYHNHKLSIADEYTEVEERKPDILSSMPPPPVSPMFSDLVCLDHSTDNSVPKLRTAESSCSEQVVVSPGFEVQSEHKRSSSEWEEYKNEFNYLDGGVFGSSEHQMSPLQDMFMYLQKQPY